ncbi:MAG: 2-dehydropantoate 2-reductase [Burkholderiaceae bacterium]
MQHTSPPRWPRIAVHGAGAVGCYYGALLAEAGAPVTLIARPERARAIADNGLLFDSAGRQRRIPIAATADPEAVRDARLVLFCVKSQDTEASAALLAPLLTDEAVVVSLQNGVGNAQTLRDAGIDAMASVVYVAASMPAPDHLLHAGRGDLVLGEIGAPLPGVARRPDRVAWVAALCERAGIGCATPPDVRVELWTKLIINCCYNAISALGRARYGQMLALPPVRELMRGVVAECETIARADGIALPDTEALYMMADKVGEAMTQATSSTSQDLERGRSTEIDALNGYISRRGAALGIATPLNNALFALVKLLELRLPAR